MFDWIRGWWTTYQLWRHDRETYDFLVNYRHDPDNFVDAPRPTQEPPEFDQHIHGQGWH